MSYTAGSSEPLAVSHWLPRQSQQLRSEVLISHFTILPLSPVLDCRVGPVILRGASHIMTALSIARDEYADPTSAESISELLVQ